VTAAMKYNRDGVDREYLAVGRGGPPPESTTEDGS
jgi:hypothetical protein